MKILLVSTNIHAEPEPVFPIGSAYLLAALKKRGHRVACLDMLVDGYEGETLKKKFPKPILISSP